MVVPIVSPSAGARPDPGFLTPFTVEHDLVGHPLLELGALAELARRLPEGRIELGSVDAPPVAGLDYEGSTVAGDAGDAVLGLEGQHRSLYFYNIETDPTYGTFVGAVLDEVIALLGVDEADVVSREGYLFIAGDTAVTSAHVDHECNVLLVTEGHKRVWLAPVGSPAGEVALEALHSGHYGTCATLPDAMVPYDLEPGQGVFIPPRAAHYVENGPGRCTALSIVFLHRGTRDEVPVYAWNARLRRLGLEPTPPGRSPLRDSAKRRSFALLKTIRGVLD